MEVDLRQALRSLAPETFMSTSQLPSHCYHLRPHLCIPILPFQGGTDSKSLHRSQCGCHENKEPHLDWDHWDKWTKPSRLYGLSRVRGGGGGVHCGTPPPLVKEYTLRRPKILPVIPAAFVTQHANIRWCHPSFHYCTQQLLSRLTMAIAMVLWFIYNESWHNSSTKQNIATGETSQVITSRHYSSLLFTSMSILTSLALINWKANTIHIHISNNSTFPFISLHFSLSLLLSIEGNKSSLHSPLWLFSLL